MVSITPVKKLSVFRVSPFQLPKFLVKKAWNGACKLWSIFGFSKPRINRSILDAERGIHESEIAYINFANKRITVNTHRLAQLGLLHRLDTILVHELGHKFCPATLKNLLLVNSAVKHVVRDDFSAQQIGNLYRDMIVNVDAHRRGERGFTEIYATFWKDNPDNVQQIIGRAYERLFQRQDTSMAYARTIIGAKPSPEIETAADQIVSIILSSRRSNWLTKAKEFAEVLKQHAPKMDAMKVYVISNVTPQDFSPEGKKCPIPPQGEADVRQLQKRLGGVIFDLRQLEEKGGDDKKPCSVNEFKKFLEHSDIAVTDNEALVWYYRDLIGGKVVKVPEVSVASGALFPFSPKTWQPGDPIHELDIVLSKSVGGLLIPGVTTKKWEMRRGHHLKVGKDYPDLDLWIDSSGSMENPASKVSPTVGAGMIVAKSFLATRKSVRVVNWSGEGQVENTSGFISDEDKIDRKIIRYFNGSTELPMDEIEEPYKVEGKPKYVVMITDLGIQNLSEAAVSRLKKVFDRSVGGTIFHIERASDPHDKEQIKETQRILREIGFNVVPVKKVADLDQHALKLTKQLFEERLGTGQERIVL